jgi:putative Holliday junction resolvase
VKYLGIDYGKKRIGVAVSDEGAVMAFPLGTVEGGVGALSEVLDIVKENEVKIAVMGESRDLSGKPNPIMGEIEQFAEQLQAAGVVVEFEPEFFTSAQALRQVQGKLMRPTQRVPMNKVVQENYDASAAALILQSYLDRLRKTS